MIVNKQRFWLLILAVILIAVNVHALAQVSDRNFNGISVIFGMAVLLTLWENQPLFLKSDRLSMLIGGLIIAVVLGESIFLFQANLVCRIVPFLSVVGLSLIASGRKGLKQYSREFSLLFILAIPFEFIISHLVDLASLTAKYAALVLWYSGFQVAQHDNYVSLPTGSVEVEYACAGFKAVEQMLRFAILHNIMFSGSKLRNVLLTVAAVWIGITCNTIRVVVLVLLLASKQSQSFEYFHGPGGHIFTVTAALLFGLLCYVLMLVTQNKKTAKLNASSIDS